jgi:pSer/pThr/pTyr-binding forkhead associated (FHA) protein
MEVVLNVYSLRDTTQVVMTGSRFLIGRGSGADLSLSDDGVSSAHASIYREGDRVWILDEGSVNGTTVDGQPVPQVGVSLRDGAEIGVGHETTIVVGFSNESVSELVQAPASAELPANPLIAESSTNSFPLLIVAGLFLALVVLGVIVVFASYTLNKGDGEREVRKEPRIVDSAPSPFAAISPSPEASTSVEQIVDTSTPQPQNDNKNATSQKLYLQMSPQEQMDFIDLQARHISLMMGNRPYTFNDDVLRYIKQYLDGYAKRVGNNSTKLWAEDLRFMFARAREQYAPYIIRSFNARGVPPVVGLYLVVVETEYHNIQSENAAGAAGLFQFIGPTARGYGVDPAERTNVAKMAPAAAAYMGDRIAEFGPDSMSVALGIAGYNRSPDSVRRDLRDVLNSENRERSFWTLVANSDKLDHYFQGENIKYVPKFFAAAIVGETPWAFGIQMQPLSTYTEIKSQPSTADAQ